MDADDDSVFVIVRWHGTGASYFRSAQVDRTRRARPASVVTDGNPKHNTSSGSSARVRWDIRDGASVFNNDACYLHPAPKEGFGFDSIGVDDVDDGCVRPSRDEAPQSSISSPPVNHLPWEVRFAVCVSRPGSIYGTTERVLGEGVLNLAEFTDSVHGKRVSEKRVEVRLAPSGNGVNDGGTDFSSSARLSVSVSVTRAPGLASKAAARLGDKGLRAKDRAVAGKLFSYLSGSPSGANKSTTNRSSGDSLPARSSEDSNESDSGFSDEMDTCESDSMPSPPMTPTRDRTEARTAVSGSTTEDPDDSFPAEDSLARTGSPGFNGNQKRHSRSWSWSMKWTSPVRRRRLDGVGEPMEVVLDDELLQTPPPRPRAPSRIKKSSEEKEDVTDKASSSAEDPAETRPKHRRTSSWTRVFGPPRRSKTPETLEAERVAKETKKAAKAEEKAAEKLAKEEKKRAKRELIARAKDEEKMFRQVLEETRQAALESLPRRRSKSDAHAACVLVTPATALQKIGEEGERFRAGSCSGGYSRNLAAALDEAARDESADGEVTGSIPGEDEFDEESAKSAARADHGEWLHVELRGQPSRHSTSIDDCPDSESIGVPPVKIPAMAFFASLDQMTARGPGACTLSCVALAEWLEDHPGRLPTAPLVSTVGEASSADSELEGSNPTGDESSHGRRGGSVRGALAFTPGDEVTHEASLDAHRRPKLVFDAVIDGASREWRKLCEDSDLVAKFPDKHFDLETALGLHVPFPVPNAEGRMSDDTEDEDKADDVGSRELGEEKKSSAKVRVDHGESFVGFLTPPGVFPGDSPTLDALTAAAPPLPEIITALAGTAPATYVVSWLDHFFVLKFATERKSAGPPGSNDSAGDSDELEGEMETVVYVMDSLGERLCEGCKRGYLLRFDGASDEAGAAAAASRFVSEVLPSRLLRQCGVDIASFAAGTKGAVEPTPEYLMRRLQIEFHRVRRR